MNRLFVAYKPPFISSNWFLGRLKKKYKAQKAGFSGTLDPAAKGVLVIAFGKYTRLFRFLAKTPKAYRTTLWLGAVSEGLDIEHVKQVDIVPPLDEARVREAVAGLTAVTSQIPPKFSAKWVDGTRAYDLARKGHEVELQPMDVTIYETRFIAYCHPYITFEATVSEGTYIRTLAQTLAERLGSYGILSSLERLREGPFVYDHEKALDIQNYIDLLENRFLGDPEMMAQGKKLQPQDFALCDDGIYKVLQHGTISIIEIADGKVSYLINQMERE
jgi:tRNA pseudouridine55 synthase